MVFPKYDVEMRRVNYQIVDLHNLIRGNEFRNRIYRKRIILLKKRLRVMMNERVKKFSKKKIRCKVLV